jgi:hypothetical protein
VTVPSTVRPFIAWSLISAVARVDVGRVHLGDVDGDGDDIGSGRDEQRGGLRTGPGQVPVIDVAPGDDAIKRGLDPGVSQHRLGLSGRGPGDVDARGGGDHVGQGLVQIGLRLELGRLGRLDPGPDLVAGRLGRPELVAGLVEQRPGLRPLVEQLLDPAELLLPAGQVGVRPLDPRPDLGHPGLGAGDGGLGELDRRLGLHLPGPGLLDRRLLLLELRLDLGHP